VTNSADRPEYWDSRYRQAGSGQVSWYEDEPTLSLEALVLADADADTSVIDIGGGASPLAAALVDRGFADITVLDISTEALDRSRAGLQRSNSVGWIVSDVLAWIPDRRFQLWHDRAAFHFLVDPADRATSRSVLHKAIAPGGAVVVATFAEDGPTTCSGLPVQRYSAAELIDELGPGLSRIADGRYDHTTPQGVVQHLTWVVLRADPVAAC
jgi:SAM-dependent methyltransferase